MVPGFTAWQIDTTGIYDPVKKTFRRKTSKFRVKGVSDIIGFYNGKFWAIEVKTPQRMGAVTKEQGEFLSIATIEGQVAMVATSVEDVELKIREESNG